MGESRPTVANIIPIKQSNSTPPERGISITVIPGRKAMEKHSIISVTLYRYTYIYIYIHISAITRKYQTNPH